MRAVTLSIALVFLCAAAQAQWVTQSISLQPGWNAIFLEVDPSPDECDTVFAGLPVESVWDFNRSVDSPQFVQDPSTLIPGARDWLTWFPPSSPLAPQSSLFILRDGRSYLIKVASNAAPVTLTLTGNPSLRRIEWRTGLNFTGFHVGTNPAPTFGTLFAGEAGLAGQPVYRLGTNGLWTQIATPATVGPRPGEALWVRSISPATRSGTIHVETGARNGFTFRDTASEQTLRIRNTSNSNRVVTVRLLASGAPPPGEPPLAGPVPVEYRSTNFGALFPWVPLTNNLTFAALPPNADWVIRLSVPQARLGSVSPGALYQSILNVSDNAGTRWQIPITAEGAGSSAGLAASGGGTPLSPHAGLWVGEALINAVSQPAHPGNPALTRPAGGQFPFRVIVHVDEAGNARLLQQVFMVRKPPTLKPDPENEGFNIVDEPGRTLVLTDEAFIPSLIGNAPVIGRRISSAAFAFSQPLALAGPFGAGTLNGAIGLDYNHPLNPFRHRFHPDHNNLDERYEQTLPEGKESFTVSRSLAFEFTANAPDGQNPPGWGSTETGGIYRETVIGLHRMPVNLSGTFRLLRASRTALLNE
jgi:hypothetical protein